MNNTEPRDGFTVAPITATSVAEIDLAQLTGDGRFRYSPAPQDIVHDNTYRASRAATALVGYCHSTGVLGTDPFWVFVGFLADLYHLADGFGVDLRAAMGTAREHYTAEIIGAN
ncbi:hypothetical protein N8J89_03790 [Crossiella sp. CA-258035]|uniref:hypothetical protein n=1 Tax=Crossiella sp. CA-258035 TaxID=2981138 RepID=UPI0024BC47AF|nr:hypothetical protein [Crossiella sp. CA-258035]WHT20206.1 hypothetical protein N8J89_03790 [Crossiella sp. CA-258035]